MKTDISMKSAVFLSAERTLYLNYQVSKPEIKKHRLFADAFI